MPINPNIFKAYDVRGLYPGEINEDAARQIGRGFAAYLNAKRIGVSRDMGVPAHGGSSKARDRTARWSTTACAAPT
jgi:phosphomannomutase